MASVGPVYPGTVTSTSVAGENSDTWVNPTNVSADDGTEAQITAASYDSPDVSFQLRTSNYNFAAIPAGSTIDGIVVEIDRRCFAGTAVDFKVKLMGAGIEYGSNKASATAWPATTAVATYGSASDLWGFTPTLAMVQGGLFGPVISVQATSANVDIGIDFIRMTVHYTPPGGLASPPFSNRTYPQILPQ